MWLAWANHTYAPRAASHKHPSTRHPVRHPSLPPLPPSFEPYLASSPRFIVNPHQPSNPPLTPSLPPASPPISPSLPQPFHSPSTALPRAADPAARGSRQCSIGTVGCVKMGGGISHSLAPLRRQAHPLPNISPLFAGSLPASLTPSPGRNSAPVTRQYHRRSPQESAQQAPQHLPPLLPTQTAISISQLSPLS